MTGASSSFEQVAAAQQTVLYQLFVRTRDDYIPSLDTFQFKVSEQREEISKLDPKARLVPSQSQGTSDHSGCWQLEDGVFAMASSQGPYPQHENGGTDVFLSPEGIAMVGSLHHVYHMPDFVVTFATDHDLTVFGDRGEPPEIPDDLEHPIETFKEEGQLISDEKGHMSILMAVQTVRDVQYETDRGQVRATTIWRDSNNLTQSHEVQESREASEDDSEPDLGFVETFFYLTPLNEEVLGQEVRNALYEYRQSRQDGTKPSEDKASDDQGSAQSANARTPRKH